MVKIYSTSWCPECIALKKYLDKKGVAYTEINVADRQEDREIVYEISGQRTVPVLDIGGKIIIGFERGEIDNTLNNR